MLYLSFRLPLDDFLVLFVVYLIWSFLGVYVVTAQGGISNLDERGKSRFIYLYCVGLVATPFSLILYYKLILG